MVPSTVKALRYTGDREPVVDHVPTPTASDGHTLIRPTSVGICGSDIHLLSGGFGGRINPPVTLGHECAGIIVDDSHPTLEPGTPVFVNPLLPCGQCASCRRHLPNACLTLGLLGIDANGGMAELLAAPTTQLHELPADANMTTASVIEPLAVALHMTSRIPAHPGDTIAIVGGGPIGAIIAMVLSHRGHHQVTVIEAHPDRRATLETIGIASVGLNVAPEYENTCDIVFEATGIPAGLNTALDIAAPAGRILLSGFGYDNAPTALSHSVKKELTLIGSRVYSDTDIRAAIELFSDPKFPIGTIVTTVVTFDDLNHNSFTDIVSRPASLKTIMTPGGSP